MHITSRSMMNIRALVISVGYFSKCLLSLLQEYFMFHEKCLELSCKLVLHFIASCDSQSCSTHVYVCTCDILL